MSPSSATSRSATFSPHTTGLPNWRPDGQPLEPLRGPGQRWGYSGEGFVLLQEHLQQRTGAANCQVCQRPGLRSPRYGSKPPRGSRTWLSRLLVPFDHRSRLRALLSPRSSDRRCALAATLAHRRRLAWGAGWGIELGPPIHGWQWGLNDDAQFVIGCPSTGDGSRSARRSGRPGLLPSVVGRELPGDHASLRGRAEPGVARSDRLGGALVVDPLR